MAGDDGVIRDPAEVDRAMRAASDAVARWFRDGFDIATAITDADRVVALAEGPAREAAEVVVAHLVALGVVGGLRWPGVAAALGTTEDAARARFADRIDFGDPSLPRRYPVVAR